MPSPPSLSRLLGAPVCDALLDLGSVERSAVSSGLPIRVLVLGDTVSEADIARFAAHPHVEFVLCPADPNALREALREFDAPDNVSAAVEVEGQAAAKALVPALLALPVRRRYVAVRAGDGYPDLGPWIYTSCACGVYDGTPMREAPSAGCGTCGGGARRELIDAVYVDPNEALGRHGALAHFEFDLGVSLTPVRYAAR